MRHLDVRRLGCVSYADGLALQQELVEERRAGCIPDTLLLLEHPPVLTVGVRPGSRRHVIATSDALAAAGIEIHETGRGGDVTYHGPGQLVAYPLVDLQRAGFFVKSYIHKLEEALIRTLWHFGVVGHRVEIGRAHV